MMRFADIDKVVAKIRDDGLLGNGYSDSEREDDVIDIVESCEVDAVPVVHGRWECHIVEDIPFPVFYVRCSQCNTDFDDETYYCPHCGARMDLEV